MLTEGNRAEDGESGLMTGLKGKAFLFVILRMLKFTLLTLCRVKFTFLFVLFISNADLTLNFTCFTVFVGH